MSEPSALARHNSEMARAAKAAMEQHYPEAIEVISELLISGIYSELSPELARKLRAEARLMLATAMHYDERAYEDILQQLVYALDSPPEVQKDAHFTLAVVHLSFGNVAEARTSMQQALDLISTLRSSGEEDAATLDRQESEARQFLSELPAA
jgi:Tfp pilus assembly protein PilF